MILAFDCGSTHFKAALFDDQLRRRAELQASTPYAMQTPERLELDAQAVWTVARDLIRAVCAQAAIPPRAIRVFSLTSQAQTFTLFDSAGKALEPFLSWADTRATAEATELTAIFGADFHRHCSFGKPRPQMQLAKLLWLRRHEPDLLKQAHSILSLPTYLAVQLGGGPVIDTNLAAMSGLYSLAENRWRAAALEAAGIHPEQLPQLTVAGTPRPAIRAADGLDLAPDRVFVSAANDQTAGALGAGCGPTDTLVTLGTALVAYRRAGQTPGPFGTGTCWGPFPGGGFYELAVADQGTSVLDELRKQWLPDANIETLHAMAESAGPLDKDLFFYPHHFHTDRAWHGAGSRPEQIRAAVEGFVFGVRRLLTEVLAWQPTGHPILLGGGASKNLFLRRLIATVLNQPVQIARGDALLGAAKMAQPDVLPAEEPALPVDLPDPALARFYETRYRQWRQHL